MESSMNAIKGYGKISLDIEDPTPPKTSQKPKPLILTLTISAAIFVTIIIALVLVALIHESNSEPPEISPVSANSIRTVCNVTQYPTTCFTTISSLKLSTESDPESIFKLSLLASVVELKNFTSRLKILNAAAVEDCVALFDDALSRLNDSVAAMEVPPGEKTLTLGKLNDIQTWVSAAMTDQDTCVDGLEEMGSAVLDEVKVLMERSKECLSNSLAIVANMQSLLQKFGLKMH